MTSGSTRRLRHTAELNGVRGLAVLLVVGLHSFGTLAPETRQLLPNGFLGVDLFFVLSGFLITALLLSEHDRRGRVRFGGFYRRRALRLLPALVLLLVAHVVYTLVASNSMEAERARVLSALFYYLNWAQLNGQNMQEIGHLWTLSIEEQFYLVWPLVLVGLLALAAWTRRAGVVIGVLVALIVGVVVMRFWMFEAFSSPFDVYSRTDARADSLLIGALAGVLWARYRVPRRGLSLAATVSLAFLLIVVAWPLGPTHAFFYRGGFTLVAIASAVVIIAVLESNWPARRVFRLRPLCAIGVVSYGLYLWHVPVFLLVNRNLSDWPTLARVGFGLAVAAAITATSWFLVERPFLRWKDKLEGDRSVSADRDAEDQGGRGEPGVVTTPPVPLTVDAATR